MPLTWFRTSPDTHYDLIATEDGLEVGRVMKNLSGPNADTWFWACTGCQHSEADRKPLDGEVQTKDEAIAALSEVWAGAKA
jgi:hypothetical protein